MAWELDVAGRIRRGIESAEASAEQSAADFGNAQLLVQTDLATAYFNLPVDRVVTLGTQVDL